MTDKRDWDDTDWAFNNMVAQVPKTDWQRPSMTMLPIGRRSELEDLVAFYLFQPPQHVGFNCAGRAVTWGPPPVKATYTVYIDGKLVQQGTVDPDGTVTVLDDPALRLPEWDDIFPKPRPIVGRLARLHLWLRHKLWFRATL